MTRSFFYFKVVHFTLDESEKRILPVVNLFFSFAVKIHPAILFMKSA